MDPIKSRIKIADPNLLDHAIWYTVTNFDKPLPGEKRLLHVREVRRRDTKAPNGH